MDSSRFFIIGANGQLGLALKAKYPEAGSSELDITDTDNIAAFDWSKYHVVINAAAYTDVDGAEAAEGRAAAWKVNASAIANLASIMREKDITFVHISTDYVFDGTIDLHTEDEPFSPLSVYGNSKAAGDIAASLIPRHYILRTSWVIGEGKNFVRTMLGLAQRDINPSVVADQIGRLTFTSELVRALDHLLTTQAPYGTYNISNGGTPASWAEVTRSIFKLVGKDDLAVTETTTEEYYRDKEGSAPRPLQSTLDLSKLQAINFTPKSWRDDLKTYIEQELSR